MTSHVRLEPPAREPPAREPPAGAEPSRRDLLRLTLGALGATALAACTRAPDEVIVPYAKAPPEITPGVAACYATALELDGLATGVLATCREGRPIKLEGNPAHPASLGATSAIEQAATLALYDPARARVVRRAGAPSSFEAFEAFAALEYGVARDPVAERGRLWFLLEPTSSPTIGAQLARVRERLPGATVCFAGGRARGAGWEGARLAFGRVLDVVPRLERADVVVALDADLLGQGPHHLAHARAFAARRAVLRAADPMSRLYVVEPSPTVTGIAADHRLALPRGEVAALAAALFARVVRALGERAPREAASALAASAARPAPRVPPGALRFADALARDLLAHEGRALVVAGHAQPAPVHALAHALNALLGAFGAPSSADAACDAHEPAILEAGAPSDDVRPLLAALDRGEVDTLVVLGGNPAFTLPGDADFAARMRKARERIVLATHEDETAAEATWLLPAAHALEAWGDARALDGTTSVAQPTIAPLFGGRSALEILALFAGHRGACGYERVRETARRARGDDFEEAWEQALAGGVLGGPSARLAPEVQWGSIGAALALAAAPPPEEGALELAIDLDPRVHDGRFANVPWLLELPDPITKLTWENALRVAPALAASLALDTGDVVELRVGARAQRVPVVVVPGQASRAPSLFAGSGRRRGAPHGEGRGVDAHALRTLDAPWLARGVAIVKVGASRRLPITQAHASSEGRPLVLTRTLDEYARDPGFAREHRRPRPTLYALPLTGERQWALTIDLAACTGCSACVVACQAENDVPHVGVEGVLAAREMHWLRVDRYVEPARGADEVERTRVQPMMCQHCEKAPCEYVCPVGATVHSPDGLNEQVYNRCVGTRFCSNNCPYKVRRFNWFDYHEGEREPRTLAHNPDVTVRARGVMEKCTYCVQRIRRAEIDARRDGRALKDGDVVTACQQVCPSGAIVFGDLRDPAARVAALREHERAYAVLDELGTQPRTRYLARLENPNPELA